VNSKAVLVFACTVALGCNAKNPTALDEINPASLHGEFLLTFSNAICTLQGLEMTFTQVSDGGALPDDIRLIGSWQVLGENFTGSLLGNLKRDTGAVRIELIEGVRVGGGDLPRQRHHGPRLYRRAGGVHSPGERRTNQVAEAQS